MVLVAVAIVGGTMMSTQAFGGEVDVLLSSTNTKSLNEVSGAEGEAIASTLSRNNVQYEILEQPGKMMMCYSEDVFTLSYVNLDKAKVAFRLVDADGNIVFSHKSKKEMCHQRVKTENLPVGDYTAILLSADDYFERDFSISR